MDIPGRTGMAKKKSVDIKPFDMKYLNDYYLGFNEAVTRYQWPDPFESIDDARQVLQAFVDEHNREETLFFAILSKEGRFIGSVEIHGLTDECPELGIWIIESEQGNGYAYKALNIALDYAQKRYKKDTFFYESDIRNEASIRLLRKLESDYDILDQETEALITDSGKELKLQGHIVKLRKCH